MANGTSVSFNYVDYRFKNNTGCCVCISMDGILYIVMNLDGEDSRRISTSEKG